MKVTINNKFSIVLTYLAHFIAIDWIWKELEISILGKVNGNDADSVLLILLCAYITFLVGGGSK